MMRAIPSTLMRGGTSKGLYFHAKDLPQSARARDRALLAAMGSPDPRQIDGVGGAHPLTSKVAIIGPSKRPDADVDYLFLQVVVDKAEVSDSQNCGNILAGVGPWSIEHGLVRIAGESTPVRIHMLNTGGVALAHVPTPHGSVDESRQPRQKDRAEDVPRFARAARRHHPYANLHPASRARSDRGVGRSQCGHGLRHSRLRGRAGCGPCIPFGPAAPGHRASNRVLYGRDGCDGAGSHRHGEPLRAAPHGAETDAGGGLRPGKRLERSVTTNPCRIGLIGLGEVGQVLANDLHRVAGVEVGAWDRLFDVEGSEPRRAARSLIFVRAASAIAEAVSGSSIVICAVTAGECRAAAGEAAPALTRGALYLDLN